VAKNSTMKSKIHSLSRINFGKCLTPTNKIMSKKLLPLLALLFLSACTPHEEKKDHTDQNVPFDAYKEHFIEALWKMYPGWASSIGYHAYDSVLVISTEGQRATELAFLKANADSLKNSV